MPFGVRDKIAEHFKCKIFTVFNDLKRFEGIATNM